MSQLVLFEIGALIFLAVVTALFLYGLAEFMNWQDRDDAQADAVRPAAEDERSVVAAEPPV